ncbi:tetratricopeptide repeat protein [Arcicella aurantiaca]|uniref:Tetratricopeptide repeat protein n=1 Tax=Arcicella aurantiaca TaxID=591202 RepID=A0A316ECC0_9BACT|nr:histidine kinase [Arcicella aurantiaca]PWK26423.1 tetratricopeptide repeat protein [Arcicella aurantiaca]
MKKIYLLLILSFLSINNFAQTAKDSLLTLLKKHPQQDVQRCYILRELRRNEVRNFEGGIEYDKEACRIALKNIPTIKNNPKLINEYKSFISDYYYNQGIVYQDDNDLKNAELFMLKSLRIEQDIKRYTDLGCSYKALASIYLDKGNVEKAEKNYYESIKFLKLRKGDIVEENNYLIDVYDNLANIDYNRGDFKKAIHFMYEKLKITTEEKTNYNYNKKINTHNIAATYNKLGFFYGKEGEDQKALNSFNTAYRIEKTIDNKQGIASIYRNIGTFFLDRDKLNQANKYFDLSSKFATSDIIIYSNIVSKGKLYLKKNNLDSAETLLNKAYKYAFENEIKAILSKLYPDLAQVYFRKNNVVLAKKYAQEGLALAQQKTNVLDAKQNAELLYVINKNSNNKDEALKMLEITYALSDSINRNENKNATLKGEFKYETELKETQIKSLAQQKQISELESNRKTTFIYSILGGILALSAIAYFLFTRFRDRKENELLTTQLEEAKRRIEIEQKATESELKALKSQMNPHFMFNALNSIQEQFMYGDKVQANEQMGNFTYLTRQILTVSGKKKINLSTEIEILTKYLELEKMRFAEGFTYEVNLSDNIDEDYHQIPPMLIQPFVENSIKHGLLHKQGDKKLSIRFDLDETEENLICVVEDNGVGREKSAEFKSKRVQQHESFSSVATEERLKLLSNNINGKDLVIYEDLKNDDNEVTGTKVTLTIALG